MEKIYFKAIAFGLVFSLAAFFLINLLDQQTIGGLEKKLNDASLDSDESQIFLQMLNDPAEHKNVCGLLRQRMDLQFGKNESLLNAITETEKSVFLQDLSFLKKKYFLSIANLYFLFKQENKLCGGQNEFVLFFYRDQKPLCADCIVQGKILDVVRQKCPNAKVFSFPVDLGYGFVDFFKAMHGFDAVPAVVLNEKTTIEDRIATEKEIIDALECTP